MRNQVRNSAIAPTLYLEIENCLSYKKKIDQDNLNFQNGALLKKWLIPTKCTLKQKSLPGFLYLFGTKDGTAIIHANL